MEYDDRRRTRVRLFQEQRPLLSPEIDYKDDASSCSAYPRAWFTRLFKYNVDERGLIGRQNGYE